VNQPPLRPSPGLVPTPNRPLVEQARMARTIQFDAPVTAAHYIGVRAAFALGDGSVHFTVLSAHNDVVHQCHSGAILAAVPSPDGKALLSVGDDGKLVRSSAEGSPEVLFETGGRWLEQAVASRVSGVVAVAAGKQVTVLTEGGRGKKLVFQAPAAVTALALDPKGRRLACAHRDGVSLYWALIKDSPAKTLHWKGAHIACTFHPSGDFLVTGMLENALHGWRLADGTDFQMRNYAYRPKHLSWSSKGKLLATSGAQVALLWPFEGKDGPMGKPGQQLPSRPGLVTSINHHKVDNLVAVGFADGGVHILRTRDGADLWISGPSEPFEPAEEPLEAGTAVEALAWSADGMRMAWGGQDGAAGWIELIK